MIHQLFELYQYQSFVRRLFCVLQRWLIITIISLFFISAINGILLKFGISIEDQSRLIEGIGSWGRKQVLLQVIVIGPIIEELMFRSWITVKWYRILLCGIFAGGILLKNGYLLTGSIVVFIGFAISGCIYFKKICLKQQYISYAIIASSVVFGMVHINNFKGFHGREILVIVPQLLLGFLLGKVRVAYGLRYSIFLHIFHNGIVGMGIVAAKYLDLWPLDETIISKPGLVVFLGFCLAYYGITVGSIIISFFYYNDFIKSNDYQKEYQSIK